MGGRAAEAQRWNVPNYFENPSTTSLIEARNREARRKGSEPKRFQVWVPLERISPNLQRAVVAGEDSNFGRITVRLRSDSTLLGAREQKEADKEAKQTGENDSWLPNLPDFKRGASTISQQLVKSLYLSSERSFMRKGHEAVITYSWNVIFRRSAASRFI